MQKITFIFFLKTPGLDYQVIFRKLTEELGSISVTYFLIHQTQNNKLYMYYV